MAPVKDYYKVLGVDKNAKAEEIKAAYRKLAKQNHPDATGNDPKAEKRFIDINEAYEVLGKPENRKQYDELREQAQSGRVQQAGRPGGGTVQWEQYGDAAAGSIDWDDILNQMFGWQGGYAASHGFGTRRAVSLDIENAIDVPLREAFAGVSKSIRIGGRQTVSFQVPAGIQSGERIRLKGLGQADEGGNMGDRYLRVTVVPDGDTVLDGLDVTRQHAITPWDAALGTSIRVKPFDKEITIRVPPGTHSGHRLRVPAQGYRDRGGNRGDLYVVLTLANPNPLPEAVRKAYEQLQKQK